LRRNQRRQSHRAASTGVLVTLINANGAGGTTTLKALAGLHQATAGRIHYNGDDVTGLPAFEPAMRELAFVP